MRPKSSILIVTLAAIATSCDSSSPGNPTAPPAPAQLNPPVSMNMSLEGRSFYLGRGTQMVIKALDSDSRLAHIDGIQVSSSNPSVVSLSSDVVEARDSFGTRARALSVNLSMVSLGSAVIRATLKGLADSITISVVPLPDLKHGLAVDSFTVIEYGVPTGNCSTCTIVYAPILKLIAGDRPVKIVSLRFDYPSASTGWCEGGIIPLAANSAAHVVDMTQYLLFNGLLVFQQGGLRLPPGLAKASVYYEVDGEGRVLEAEGVIQRDVANPVFPLSPFIGFEWSCHD